MINSITYAAYSLVLFIPNPNIQNVILFIITTYYATCGYIAQYIYVQQKVMLCSI